MPCRCMPLSLALLICASLVLPSPTLSAQQSTPVPPPSQPAAQGTLPAPSAQGTAPSTQPSAAAKDPNDPIERIKDEGLNRSQVIRTLGYLTDVIGPRLTASPSMKRANDWTRDKLIEWGLQNSHLEAWGPFGRGWSLKRFSVQVIEPQTIPLIAYPKAWSPGTTGPLTGEVIYVDANTEAELQKYKGKLKGAIVLTSSVREIKAHFEPLGTRLSEKELLELANAAEPTGGRSRARRYTPEQRALALLSAQKTQFFHDEGAALLVDPSRIGDGGTIFVGPALVPQPFSDDPSPLAALRRATAWKPDAPKIIPQIVVATEHYNRMVRMLQQGEKLKLEADISAQFHDGDLMGYNTIAEIPGTDLKDEVVMLGGHLDSWHAGTGATDNAAGCAVGMEAVRILQALKLQPRRTIRIALWSGEEQGLLGSRAYVAKHLATLGDTGSAGGGSAQTDALAALMGSNGGGGAEGVTPRLALKPAYEKFSAYFNLDNGTGRIRGVYLQGNEAVRPIFRRWLAPFRDLGATTLTIDNTGGTDHLSFDAVGLPGFQFIQDEIEYDTRTHHSNQDVFDRIQADDMRQAAVIMAAFIYNTAMMNEKLPRKQMKTS